MGLGVGTRVGLGVGAGVGLGVGACVGLVVGAGVGLGVGACVGLGVGAGVGDVDGSNVVGVIVGTSVVDEAEGVGSKAEVGCSTGIGKDCASTISLSIDFRKQVNMSLGKKSQSAVDPKPIAVNAVK